MRAAVVCAMGARALARLMCLGLIVLSVPVQAFAQERLTLQVAIDEALRSRPSIKAALERVSVAQGMRQQAAARLNADFQFANENLRRGQTYSRDVDTIALLTQPFDLAGKRTARIAVADRRVENVTAQVDLDRIELIHDVTMAYWEAREAQEARDVLQAAVTTFQQVVDYHSAQFRVGTLPEQDLLRVQLESERLKIAAGVGALDASRARAELLKLMGRRPSAAEIVFTEPFDLGDARPAPLSDEAVVQARVEMRIASAAVAQAEAEERFQRAFGRPDFSGLFGYKRTQLPDATNGVNTLIAGFRVSVPWGDRNQGNRAAASAEIRREQAQLEDVRLDVLAEYHAALSEYTARQAQMNDIVNPLRQHAINIAQLAQAAYTQGGMDLLRLLDARRAQLDAELAWVHAMADYQQSVAELRFAGGQIK